MKKILLTAFEPFGLTGKFLRHANASADIFHIIKARLDAKKYDFLMLPVSDGAPAILLNYLNEKKPSGIVSLGEQLGMSPNTVRVEPYAHDLKATLNPLAPLLSKKILTSPFVEAAFPENIESSIGAYHCNDLYRTALKWSAEHQHPPTAFVHIAVLGNRVDQGNQILDVVTAMQKLTSQKPQTTPHTFR